jgi:hypothetical protein
LSQGSHEEFFAHWKSIMANLKSVFLQNLEFKLQVYFAIFPIHPSTVHDKKDDYSKSMQIFKLFLENAQEYLNSNSQLAVFFALPYSSAPDTHPSFKELFTDKWVNSLISEMSEAVLKVLASANKEPLLVQLLNSARSATHEKKSVNETFPDNEGMKDFELIKKLENLQHDHRYLLEIVSEVVSVLAGTMSGKRISNSYMDDVLRRISKLLKPKSANTKPPSFTSSSDKFVSGLNYKKIKSFFSLGLEVDDSVRKMELTLHALKEV